MGITTGILLFDDFEELDAVGPWEVFTMAKSLSPEDRVVTIAPTREPVRAAKGLRVIPDHSFADAPQLDVVLVPGGQGTRREVANPELIEWLRKAGAQCKWVTSVCTGALLLHEAGFAKGKRVTTHWGFVEQLQRARQRRGAREHALRARRESGHGGGRLGGHRHGALARRPDPRRRRPHARYNAVMEYDPAPPYAAEV